MLRNLEEMEQHEPLQPSLYQEAEDIKAARPAPADSPPPNCAICLGTCTNKCFTDCCMHQFCFNCLLEWSKIKAECPLCKQPFKSIIYNIKSNLEYEEHIITNPERDVQGEALLLDEDVHTEYLFLPNGPRPQRHFQFRTTLTVDPGGEFAIQQLLLSHPRTNSLYLQERYHHRIPQQTINFRRAVYHNGWCVDAQPDITGRYRECTPNFFRENPAQTHRIIPWLNRELTALVAEYNEIYIVQEHIMEMLCQYPIRSASFRTRIVNFLGNRTDQFIHEFYNFVRSPFDMIGYDRHVSYSQQRPPLITSQSLSDDDDDSDVRVVDSPNDCIYVPPRTPEVIVINSDSDSDVIIRSTPPLPDTPPILVDSESDTNINVTTNPPTIENERQENSRSPQLPIKIRLKINRNQIIPDMCKVKQKREYKSRLLYDSDSNHPKSESEYSTAHISSSGNCSSSSDENNSKSCWTANKTDYKYVQTLVLKRSKSKQKSRKRKSESKYNRSLKKSRSKQLIYNSDTPLDSVSTKRKKSKKSSKSKKSKREKKKRIKVERYSSSSRSSHHSDSAPNSSSDEDDKASLRHKSKQIYDNVKLENSYSSEPTNHSQSSQPDTLQSTEDATNETPQDLSIPGPSQVQSLRSVIVKGNNMWYSRPDLDEASSDNNSD